MDDVLEMFGPATRAWFAGSFGTPTPAQSHAWRAVSAGRNALVVAPTGSGKTLAAFLWSLDRIASEPRPADPALGCRVVYVSPLKALTVDVARNLQEPLDGITKASAEFGLPAPSISTAVRTGDTPADQRRRFARRPADILITTPESLFLLLTSQAREALHGVHTVIVDEVHAVAATKRGAHLALSLERLDALLPRPAQRIGLSATVRPVEEVARFLGGSHPVEVVAPQSQKDWDLQVVVPVPDLAKLDAVDHDGGDKPGGSIWPHVEQRVADLIEQHRSTIVFANSRRLAERLTSRLNEIAEETPPPQRSPAELVAQSGTARGAGRTLARAHHGSVSKEQRALIEDDLKAGRIPAVVATSSLELGIDMGAVDLVVQVEAPPSVASGLQRVGRAGHQVGAVSRGVLFPKFRGDLVQTAVVSERMRAGQIEELRLPRNPLDVLAQHVVAMVAMDDWPVDQLLDVVRKAYPFAQLPESSYRAVLDMLAGRYPSDEFAELRPRLVWDRDEGMLRARPGSQRLAVTSGGTIPDRGLFGVYLAGGARNSSRVGELDEEMVYESRVGDVFSLGATSWRIEEITHDRVTVSPAPGRAGRLPFWKGDTLGRPMELGAAVGAFVREVASADDAAARERGAQAGLDEWATDNLLSYLREQRAATGQIPDDTTIVVERFRDELGDWRLVVHSPFGAQVHAPWALALDARLRERYGVDVQAVYADDGIILRIPDTFTSADAEPTGGGPDLELVVLDPDDVDDLVTAEVGASSLFASRFRECAARALLLPRRQPGRRSPLWQQRQRSAQLLSVAAKYGSFPMLLETMRECLQDVYDLPGLNRLMQQIASGEIRVVEVETPQPSPFAKSLLFGYVADFMYEGDSPLAERRAQALTLDSTLLSELLGRAELRELLDPEMVERTEAELQRLVEERRARDAEAVADLLRQLGPLTADEVAARCVEPDAALDYLQDLSRQRRVVALSVAGDEHWAAVEDVARLRDALGVSVPAGVHPDFLEAAPDPLTDLVARYARTHGPFHADAVAARFGLGRAVVDPILRSLTTAGRVVEGQLRPGGSGTDWCDADVLRLLRRRSLAILRKEAEPVDAATLGRFLPVWQSVGSSLHGPDGLMRVVEQLDGVAVPATALERLVLPARLSEYNPAWLDELTTAGEVIWAGRGVIQGTDGWVSLHLADTAPLTLPMPEAPPDTPVHRAIIDALHHGGGFFYRQLADSVAGAVSHGPTAPDTARSTLADVADAVTRPPAVTDEEITAALWDLVWAGLVTNDTLAAMRALLSGSRGAHRSRPVSSRSRYRRGRAAMPVRSGPPTAAGRWSLLPEYDDDPTRRAHAAAEALLDRHGVVTRGAVVSERLPGGFAAAYKVLAAFEESGRARRGYFVGGLGAAQFATVGAVDRLRTFATTAGHRSEAASVVLAATDPANPYGAALPWPERPSTREGATDGESGHRPGRKAGAMVVLVDGELVLYVERGGRTILSWHDHAEILHRAAVALAATVRHGGLGGLRVERADGEQITGTPLGEALSDAGFYATPRGLRLRS
ncbi:ATP-dependent helicase [Phytoactinopolyspora alkaliphila]|uniref:ATP-dependent helicase n=1 Tax=Phytoactinopolyspora alkaliphila TaxID=1783498 RepID=A0A6N9YFR6_9ACTN|nr:ATP-dependent helicase [Phytoactinopolyspora alkaliphila]NED93767.1 ATP-dependent helicase [Phytoactinopolyspora alkaliphila]